jgi:Gpi18-like mannosyltransferase
MSLASHALAPSAQRTLTGIHIALAAALAATLLRLALYAALSTPYGDFPSVLCHFDCDFYMRIATHGYGSDTHYHDRGSYPNWAYFPLLPVLVRVVADITGVSALAAGVAVAAGAFAALAWLSGLYVERARVDGAIGLWLLTLFVAPFGFFFSVPYTEGLFAAAAFGVLLARQRDMPLLAAAFAAIGSASRPTGVLLSVLVIADQAVAYW